MIFVIAKFVRSTFLFQAYGPDTLRFNSADQVYIGIVVRINKKEELRFTKPIDGITSILYKSFSER